MIRTAWQTEDNETVDIVGKLITADSWYLWVLGYAFEFHKPL